MTDMSTNNLNLLGGLFAVLGALALIVLDSPIVAAVLFAVSAIVFLQAMRVGKRR
jgi:energy-converting hydrogenase Eha subunit C